MAQLGKRLKQAYDGIGPGELLRHQEAVKLVKNRSKAKFDETVEIAMNLASIRASRIRICAVP